MFDSEIVIALIGLSGSALGTFGGIMANARLTSYRLQKLEDEVRKHNGVIERTHNLESHQAVLDEQIKVANHRLNDLEKVELEKK